MPNLCLVCFFTLWGAIVRSTRRGCRFVARNPNITYHCVMPSESSPSPDRIRTIAEPTNASILILGSKFLAAVAPAQSIGEAELLLHQRSRRYPDASHHCWGYRIGRPGDLMERSSDAGEPSGTAGRPILDALRGACLENVACVVSRYFGGTKLGTGGLVRAYADATNAVIAETTAIEQTIVRVVNLDFNHERTGIVYRSLDEFGIQFQKSRYDERVHGTIDVPSSNVARLRDRLFELAQTGIDWNEGALRLR